MLINLRNALMAGKRLPYDAEVEYLRVDAVGPCIVIDGVTYCDAVGTYYAFTISSGGVVTHDLIPVRRGNVGYMYDRTTNKLFGNAGTGDFVVGQDVVPVEYIESHGTEWIDTGYIPNMNSVFDVTFSPNNVDFVGHPVHGNAYAATNKYTSSIICPLTLWTSNNYNNRFFYAPVAMNGLVVGQKYHIVQSAASLSRDGVVVGNYDSSQMRTPLVEPMWLFAYMNSQTERLYGLLRMYSWNVSELGISMRSMLPVRVGTDATSWEGAMMDTLTRRIYRNAGTGAFTYGNDLKYPIPAS